MALFVMRKVPNRISSGKLRTLLNYNILLAIPLLLSVLLTLPTPASPAVAVDPVQQAVEVGEDAKFVCTRDDKGSPDGIVWTFNGIDIVSTDTNDNSNAQSQANSQQRVRNVNGTLTIRNATKTEKGWWVCSAVSDSGKSAKQKVQLVVYTMPGYLEELLGIGIACGVLGIIVAILYTQKIKRGKRLNAIKAKGTVKIRNAPPPTKMEVYSVEKEGKLEFEF